MKKAKKLTAILLASIIAFSMSIIPASANTDVSNPAEQTLYTVLDKIVNALVNGIGALVISPKWDNIKNYKSENFYPGLSADEFLDEPAEGAKWSVGYANASIQDGNELDEKHFVGGSLSVTRKVATEVRDDQKVRTVAMSDGRGITIFSTLDAFGLANNCVREIRARFAEYAAKKNLDITSVNVSVLHQHSCVDTFGMNGDIFKALFTAPIKNLFGMELESGINKDFQENLYNKVVNSMIEAVEGMKEGKLYYGSVDVSEFIRDKRAPEVYDPNLERLRFDPEDGSDDIWIVEGGIHCVGNGAAGTVVTGDYPYYMEQYVNSIGANLIYLEGAELALSDTDKNEIITPDPELAEKYGEGYGELAEYGRTLAKRLESIDNEEEVKPILNIAHKEMFVTVKNAIFKFAAKFGLLTNTVVRDGLQLKVATEIGYAEFGDKLAIALIPGELAAEIAFGGAMTADDELNWTGKDWEYPSFQSLVPGKKLLVYGLMNDQVGYILTDNSWHSIFTENEEIVATGNLAGSCIAEGFTGLLKDINRVS